MDRYDCSDEIMFHEMCRVQYVNILIGAWKTS
jgi:hypothetical protein